MKIVNTSLNKKISKYVEDCIKDVLFQKPVEVEKEIKENIKTFLKSLGLEDIEVLVLWGMGFNVIDVFKVFIGYTKDKEKKVLKIKVEI